MSDAKSKVHEYKVLIRESHLDTFGHMNNATYLQLFEEARWEFVTAGGFGLKKVQESQIGPTILEIKISFQREIRLREWIVIRSEVTSVARKTMTITQTMINSAGEEACKADFVAGLFDLKARRLIEPTPEWMRAVGLP